MITNSIYSRRSIRRFLDKDVPPESIRAIIDAGRMAPSAKNKQPWRYIILRGKARDEFLSCMESGIWREEHVDSLLPASSAGIADAKRTLQIMREAPVIIAVLNPGAKSPFLPVSAQERVAEICDTLSIGASVENILLKAEEMGLGTLWIANTFFAYPELAGYLGEQGQLTGAVAVGYANETPPQRPRKSMEEICHVM